MPEFIAKAPEWIVPGLCCLAVVGAVMLLGLARAAGRGRDGE